MRSIHRGWALAALYGLAVGIAAIAYSGTRNHTSAKTIVGELPGSGMGLQKELEGALESATAALVQSDGLSSALERARALENAKLDIEILSIARQRETLQVHVSGVVTEQEGTAEARAAIEALTMLRQGDESHTKTPVALQEQGGPR